MSDIEKLKLDADDDLHPLHLKLMELHHKPQEYYFEIYAEYQQFRKERGQKVVQDAVRELLNAGEVFFVIQLLAKNLMLLITCKAFSDEPFKFGDDEEVNTKWLMCGSLLQMRAREIAGWVLGMRLPEYGNIDWKKILETFLKVSTAKKMDGDLFQEVMDWVRAMADVAQQPAPVPSSSRPHVSRGGFVSGFKEAFAVLNIPYNESNQRRISNLSRETGGPLHSVGKGHRKVLISVDDLWAWWERVYQQLSQAAVDADERDRENKVHTATAFEITSRSAHGRNQKEVQLGTEDGLTAKIRKPKQ